MACGADGYSPQGVPRGPEITCRGLAVQPGASPRL